MSEHKIIKFLFETQIQKEVEKKISTKSDDGTETIKPTKVLEPFKLAILKPNRKLNESAEIYYAKTIALFIKEGLLPYSLVEKKFLNDGNSLLDEKELNNLKKIQNEIEELNSKVINLLNEKDEKSLKERSELLIKITNLSQEVNRIKGAYSNIFDNTAEIKARDRILIWWTLFLSYVQDDKGNYKSLFGEGNFEDRLKVYDEYEEKDDLFYNDLIRRFIYLISFWFASRNNVELKEQDFKDMEKTFNDSISNYKSELEKLIE